MHILELLAAFPCPHLVSALETCCNLAVILFLLSLLLLILLLLILLLLFSIPTRRHNASALLIGLQSKQTLWQKPLSSDAQQVLIVHLGRQPPSPFGISSVFSERMWPTQLRTHHHCVRVWCQNHPMKL